jgi:MFS family permease
MKMLNRITNFKELALLYLSILLFATAIGIDAVTFPTILNNHDVNPANIGISFTFDIAGGILAWMFLSKIVARFGLMIALGTASFSYAAIILGIYFYQGFFLWTLLIFLMGICWFVYFITRQAWLNILVTDAQRGVALGLFSMISSAGLFLGPVIVTFSGAESYDSFLISALLVVISFLVLHPLRKTIQPKISPQKISVKDFIKNNPRCFLARFFLDFQSYFLMSFSVIFGNKIGLSYEAAGLLISAYMASGFCDIMVGFLLKKFNPYKIINAGFLGCMYCFIAIIFYNESYKFLLTIYFIFGIFIACIYVAVFKVTNDDYSKEKLVAANSTFQFIGYIGALSGSLTGGFLFNIIGTQGFPITIVLSCAFYLIFLVIYEKKYAKKN